MSQEARSFLFVHLLSIDAQIVGLSKQLEICGGMLVDELLFEKKQLIPAL